MRTALAVILLFGSPTIAQTGLDPCGSKCGENLVGCTTRCEADQKCSMRCVKLMDDCNAKCAARAPKAGQPKGMPKMCPGLGGKLIPCADMAAGKPIKPAKDPSLESQMQAGRDLMKKQKQ